MQRYVPQYDRSTQAVLSEMNIVLDTSELNCCGYPVRNENFAAFVTAAARNIAMAAHKGLPLLTACKCCYGSLKHADYWMGQDPALRRKVNAVLAGEGLTWKADTPVRHLLNVLDEDVGEDRLRAYASQPLTNLRAAASYGCHALRPGYITRFDNPLNPSLFERLIAATGAVAVEWPLSLECCGRPLWEKNNHFSAALMNNKITDARQSGAQILVTACTHCQMQFDGCQPHGGGHDKAALPAVLYPQLLGTAMGLAPAALGLPDNRIPWEAG